MILTKIPEKYSSDDIPEWILNHNYNHLLKKIPKNYKYLVLSINLLVKNNLPN